MQMTKEYKIRN